MPLESGSSRRQTVAIALHTADKASHPAATGDYGHIDHNKHDHVMLTNAHPHADGPSAHDGAAGKINTRRQGNHGFASIHVSHDSRDKRPEHHPPAGLDY